MARVDFGETDDTESRAAAWVVRSAEGPLSVGEQRHLDDWLSENSRHLGAYVRAQAAWLDVDRLAALDSGSVREPVPQVRYWPWRRMALAASVALALTGGIAAHEQLAGRISTDRAEVRRVALDDGSTVFLNGDSVLQVRFVEHERRVILRSGEASFKVAHDTARPFVVEASGVAARAVGTDFAVGIGATGDVSVTVSEGVVKVSDQDAGGVHQHLLHRDEQFVAATTGARRAELDPREVARRLAWRNGQLVFRGQMLSSAAAEVNRYSDKPVVINDPTLGRAEFIGVFHVGDARAFAYTAAQAFNGQVVETDKAFVLSREQNSPSH